MQRAAIHLGLLLATVASVFTMFFLSFREGGVEDRLWGAGLFAGCVVLILGAHEMGHWAMARAHGVETSLPYFIPVPFGFGTLGAVIRLRGAVPNKNALVDIGAAGPLCGLLVAVPLLGVGLSLSHVDAAPQVTTEFPPAMSLWGLASAFGKAARAWVEGTTLPPETFYGMQVFGDNLLTLGLQRLVVGPLAPGTELYVHPVFLAAWFGLLVTMLNLLPVGQLDGGHLTFAWFGPRAIDLGHAVASGLLVAALFFSASWLVWFFMLTQLIGFEHPPVVDDAAPLSTWRKGVCTVCFVATVLVVMPVPLGVV